MRKISYTVIDWYEADSSNNLLKSILESHDLPEFCSVNVWNQTAGRGQINTSWHSEKHQNLTFSVVIYPNFDLDLRFYISKLVSIAVFKALNHYVWNLKIKWPNDMYIGNKKIGGILIENSIAGQKIKQSIIGIGININQTEFPDHLPNPISIKQTTGKDSDTNQIREDICNALKSTFNDFRKDFATNRVDERYHKNLFRLHKESEFVSKEGKFKGRITGTNREGFLLIDTEKDGLKPFDLKSVKYCL